MVRFDIFFFRSFFNCVGDWFHAQRSQYIFVFSSVLFFFFSCLITKHTEYQRAFTEIRLATGLNSVEDMIGRYNQHTSHTEEMDKQIVEIRTEVRRKNIRKIY